MHAATATGCATTGARDGDNTVHWRENGMEYWAVSDLEARMLETFVRA